jgi:multicomponent Na+:H+ antiporter subunit B
MQLVVEILSLIILVRATIRKDLPFSTSGRWLFNTICTVAFLVVFLVIAFISLKGLPAFGNPIMRVSKAYLDSALSKTGAMNVVSAITLNFRALDTLGEATILFTAIIGVLAVARKNPHSKER